MQDCTVNYATLIMHSMHLTRFELRRFGSRLGSNREGVCNGRALVQLLKLAHYGFVGFLFGFLSFSASFVASRPTRCRSLVSFSIVASPVFSLARLVGI